MEIKFYLAGMRSIVAMDVLRVDWGMIKPPKLGEMRLFDDPYKMAGLRGEGQTLWLMPDFELLRKETKVEILLRARHQQFTVSHYDEHPDYHRT